MSTDQSVINIEYDNALMQRQNTEQAADYMARVFHEATRPSVTFRPSIKIDGDKWCALYGDNLQDGVCGFGDTPDAAMRDFDKNWASEKP